MTVHSDGYIVSNDPARPDVDAIHAYLTRSYWATGIPRAIGALACALHRLRALRPGRRPGRLHPGDHRLGHVRLSLRCVRPRGPTAAAASASGWSRTVLADHGLQGIRRLALTTRDAHGLYEKAGFTRTEFGRFMDKTIPDVYEGR